jgi:hypothetical protein
MAASVCSRVRLLKGEVHRLVVEDRGDGGGEAAELGVIPRDVVDE